MILHPDSTPTHVVAVRSAHQLIPEIEAILAEQDMPASMAPVVADLADTFGWGPRVATWQLKRLIRPIQGEQL